MFRTPYLVRIKVSIFNQSKIFDSPFSNGNWPSLLSPCLIFLVNPLPISVYSTYKPLILDGFLEFWCFFLDLVSVYSTYKPLILDGFLKFWCFFLDLARTKIKTPSLSFKLLLSVLNG